jgi:type IX secretion system PorP/SprF family membrane protein
MSRILKIVLLLTCVISLKAQHSTLTSNYLFNLFAVNPAYAGQKGALDATTFYRKQWAGFNGSPETYGAMGHLEIRPKNFGLGLQVQQEKIALFTDTKLIVAFAYKLKFDKKNALSFGVSPGFKRTVTNWNGIITSQSGDATFTDLQQPQSRFLAGSGLFYNNEKFYAGISTPDMLMLSSADKDLEFNFIAGYVYKLKENISIKPSTLIRGLKNSPVQFDASVTAYFNQMFGIGCSYRNRESLILFTELLIKNQFKIGYAYDYNISKLRKFNSGSHEIMLNYFFGKTTNAVSPRFF